MNGVECAILAVAAFVFGWGWASERHYWQAWQEGVKAGRLDSKPPSDAITVSIGVELTEEQVARIQDRLNAYLRARLGR